MSDYIGPNPGVGSYIGPSPFAFGWQFIDKQTAGAIANIDFVLPTGFDAYQIMGWDIVPATDDVDFQFQVSNNGGSSFISIAVYDSACKGRDSVATDVSSDQANTGQMVITSEAANEGLGNVVFGETFSFDVKLFSFRSASNMSSMTGTAVWGNSTQVHGVVYGGQQGFNVEVHDAIRMKMSTGNITSGTFVLFGLRIP